MGKINPFDFVKDLSYAKIGILNEDNEEDYIPYLTNKAFSFFPDSILYAEEMNMNAHLDKDMQFAFYLHGLRKGKRYSGKWPKREYSNELLAVAAYHDCSFKQAREDMKILTEEQIEEIVKWQDTSTK